MKFSFPYIKVKGSIMGLVLTITMLVTLLSSMFILKSGMDTEISLQYETNDKLINNAESGLQLLLSGDDLVQPNSSTIIDLYEEGNDSVYLERKSWGVFEIITSESHQGKKHISKSAMIGSRNIKEANSLSVYVADLGKPLSVCGHTRLAGICHVPESGFKRAYIEGQNYDGDKYVFGSTLKSERNIPELDKSFVKMIEAQIQKPISLTDSVVNIQDISLKDTLIRSFDKSTLVLFSSASINLFNIVLIGNIKLVASSIKLTSSVYASNVILIAKTIELEEGFVGELQAFASEQIQVGKKAELHYPSVLGVIRYKIIEDKEQEMDIFIGEECKIVGDIFSYGENSIENVEAYISIDKNTEVTGNVYVNGKLDIKGKIFGSTYCNRFYLKTNSGIYENHLLNAELDATKLPKHYLGSGFLKEGNKKEVLLWF